MRHLRHIVQLGIKELLSLARDPVLLFLIAGFIGTIFIGMLLPILSMSEYIK